MTEDALNRQHHTRASVESIAATYRTWGRWGADDELGAANRLTPARVAAAAALVRRGVTFSLAVPMDRTGPNNRPGAVRVNPQHVMLRMPQDPMPIDDGGRQRFTDDAVYMPLQSATQWDALCHAFYDGQTYNGHTYESVTAAAGATRNSITNLGARAVGRGVLLDLPRSLGRDRLAEGEAIQSKDLERCARDQGVEVGEGDFVLVRTGHLQHRRHLGAWGDYCGGPAPGLGVDAAHFLCSRRVVAVATDTWGIEAVPFETPDMFAPLHVVLLVNAGIYIGEIWDLEELADDCASDGRYEFFLVAPPLTITGAVGSPLHPVAMK